MLTQTLFGVYLFGVPTFQVISISQSIEADLSGTIITPSLDLSGSTFASVVDLSGSVVSGVVDLSGSTIQRI